MANGRKRGLIPGFIIGFPALVTIMALGFAVPLLLQAKDFVAESASVQGEVVSVRELTECSTSQFDRNGRSITGTRQTCATVFYPTVQFTAQTGAQHEHEIMKFVNRFHAKPGDVIALRYVRSDPYKVQLDNWQVIWGLPLGLTALGLLFGFFWGGMVWLNRKARASGTVAHRGPRQHIPIWVTLTTLVIPGALALLTGVMATDTWEFHQNSRLTDAVVVEASVSANDYPVLRFANQWGERVEDKPETSPFDRLNVANAPTKVRHRLDDPSIFRAAPTVWSIWKPTITVAIFALLFGVVLVSALRFIARS